jgi:hypothetical protein
MLIELSEFNLKLLIPLIFPIFKRIEDYSKKAYIKEDNQLFKTFRYFLSYIFAFIPFLIIKFRTKNANEKNKILKINKIDTNSTRNFTITNSIVILKEKKKIQLRKLKSFLFLFSLCILGLFCYFYRFLFEISEFAEEKQSIGIFFEIADYVVLSRFILKQKLYKHNFVSAGIISAILMILFIISFPYIETKYIFRSFAYYFFFSLCFGSYDILGKRYMINFFVSPYYLMFIIGSINVILMIIYELFAYFLNPDVSGIIIGFKNNVDNIGKFFLFILDIFLEGIWNLGIWLTVYYLTPCHYFISEYISEYVYYMISALESLEGFYSKINIAIFSISYFINFFCCLVFNEVIILNFFGLDFNTKKRIEQRIREEHISLGKINLVELNEDKSSEEEQTE